MSSNQTQCSIYTITPIKLQVEAYNKKNPFQPQFCTWKEFHFDAPMNRFDAERAGMSFEEFIKTHQPEFEITTLNQVGFRICHGCLFEKRVESTIKFVIKCPKMQSIGRDTSVGDAYDNWAGIEMIPAGKDKEMIIKQLLTTQNIECQLANGNTNVPLLFMN